MTPPKSLRPVDLVVFGLFFVCAATKSFAVPSIPTDSSPLDSWSFADTNTWSDDYGDVPISFTNLSVLPFGAGNALVVNDTNAAWLQFGVFQDGYTNMTVNEGTVTMWFSPQWTSARLGGTGPGGPYGSLLETGSYTPGADYGWWSIYIDSNGENIYFSAQTNNGLQSNYLSAPISWTNGGFHLIAVAYTATNSQIFLDGTNAASGAGVAIYPDNQVLSNGFWIGSASNGIAQCHGAISGLTTYNYALDSNTIYGAFTVSSIFYGAESQIAQAPSSPGTVPQFNAITGPGYLITVSTNNGCGNTTNVNITNAVAVMTTNGVSLTFSIVGGSNGLPYDVFATPAITKPLTNGLWTWMGQGYQCCTYTIPGLTNSDVFLILGTPQDSYGNGLTDAYELLVLHQNPADGSQTGDGMLDGWKVLWGMNPLINNSAQPSQRANYLYDGTGRIESDSGVLSELFGFDAEGNITSDQP